MKKFIISIISITLILAMCLSFASCAKSINIEKTVKKLERKGFEVTKVYESEEETAYITSLMNMVTDSLGGGITFEIVYQIELTYKDDAKTTCQIIEFATEEQCKEYYGLYVCDKAADSKTKAARVGTVMVTTNSEVAQKVLKLNFQ